MDGNYGLNLEAALQHINAAQTFSLFFPRINRALVVDLRRSGEEGPLVRVLPMARSAAERLRTLKRLRPNLPRASEIVTIPWTGYVEHVVSSGMWAKIMARLDGPESARAREDAQAAFDELRRIERQEMTALIRGDQYETIWARTPR